MFDPMRLKHSLRGRMFFAAVLGVIPALIALGLAGYAMRHPGSINIHLTQIILIIASAAGLIGLIASLSMVRKTFNSIRKYQKVASSMAAGQLEIDFEVSHEEELTALSKVLSDLAHQTKLYCSEIEDQNQNLERIVNRKTDELRQKNLALAFQNEKILDATQMKSEFLANVSHELRTPLNAILALSEMLHDEISGPMNDEQKKQAIMILTSGENLLHLINQVLDLSKIEAGRMEVNLEKSKVVAHLVAAANRLRALAEEKDLVLRIETEDEEIELVHDREKLRQIFVNLIGNAIKFTETGEIIARIKVRDEDKMLHVSVQDTGPGIPKGVSQKIFQEFSQLEGSESGKNNGTGLGLAISRQFVQLLGGEIWVESTPGVGSLFTFTVPLKESMTPGAETNSFSSIGMEDPEIQWVADPNEYQKRILVIDSDETEIAVLERYLKRERFDVVAAQTSNDVKTILHKMRIDLVILEFLDQHDTDYSFISEVKKDSMGSNVPIIVNTSRKLMPDDIELLETKSQAIFQKENGLKNDLIKLIRAVLSENLNSGDNNIQKNFKGVA